MISEIESKIIKFIQGDIPLETCPYKQLAKNLQLEEEEIVAHIKKMQEKGLIRRLGAVLRHQKAGFTVNTLVAWKIDENKVDEVGNMIAQYNEISHCYLREVPESFGYNFFSMIHSRSDEENLQLIHKIVNQTGIKDYIVIKSQAELKKTSMTYF